MFESVVLRRSDTTDQNIDAGLLAEALLFYQNVHLLLDQASLAALLDSVGSDNLQFLLDSGFVKATFVQTILGVRTESLPTGDVHDFIEITFVGSKEKGKLRKEEQVAEIFERSLGKSWATKRNARKFLSKVPIRKISDGVKHPSGIPGLCREDLENRAYIQSAAKIVLKGFLPKLELPPDWKFKAYSTDKGFLLYTNLDFANLPDDVTPALVMSYVLSARADLWLSSEYLSEFVTTSISSKIAQLKFGEILGKRFRSTGDLELFQKLHLDDAKALRYAINSGHRSFDEFLELLEKASKFKKWLQEAHPDKGLLKEYVDAVSKETWLDKLPAKSARFLTFTGAGLGIDALVPTGIGVAAGIAVGAADSFILDKFLNGWRPNQFVEDRLAKFTNQD